MTDRLTGDGLKPGTRGVVVERTGSRVVVDFDAGFGTHRATVRSWDVRVVRHNGGFDAFHRRAHTLGWARFGVALALLAPFGVYAARYVLRHHSTSGLVPSLIIGVADSFVGLAAAALSNPIQAVIYLAILTVLSRFAFGR
jgi:hypothetical protein